MSDTTLVIIRHGETEGNVRMLMTGSTDTDITEKGVQQACDLGRKLNGIEFNAAYSSDLSRAVITAEEVLSQQKTNGFHLKIDKRIRERDFRYYENYDVMSLLEKFKMKKNLKNVYTLALDPTVGEPLDAVYNRIRSFLRDVYLKHKGENVLISTHAIVGLIMSNMLLGKGLDIKHQDNCCYNIIKIRNGHIVDYETNSHKIAAC